MNLKAEELYDLIQSTGLVNNLVDVSSDKSNFLLVFEGSVKTKIGKTYLRFYFPNTFPFSKPLIQLRDGGVDQLLPHLDSIGNICYLDNDNYVLDYTNPCGIIQESLNRAIEIIEIDKSKVKMDDFVSEFNAFWEDSQGAVKCLSILPVLNQVTKVVCCITDEIGFIGKNKQAILDFFNRVDIQHNSDNLNWRSAVYIPLPEYDKINFPGLNTFWSIEIVKQFIRKNIGAWVLSKVNSILARDKYQPVIFNLPLSDKESILFGIHYKYSRKKVNSAPLIIERLDKEFLLPRAGALPFLSYKKVMVIGCGAIGGFVAVNLSQLGVGEITLVDSQNYSTSNIHRHVLGSRGKIFHPKVDNVKKEIESKFIHTKVLSIPHDIEKCIMENESIFENIDLVIVATGKPSINMWLNRYLYLKDIKLPIIYTWVDPLGLGGHSLVTNNSHGKGCYQCLYKLDTEAGMYNMASFAEKGQSFLKSHSGCIGLFVPYSSLDAQRTSIQTVRMAIEILEGTEINNPLISWKGSSAEFLSNGFQLSPRYHLSTEEIWKRRYQYTNSKCQICGGKTNFGPMKGQMEEE